MAAKKYRYFSCDFETTVYEGQDHTEVWASAIVELGTEDVVILHSIDETFKYLKSLRCNCICYYHNLKFDGQFWLYYLLHNKSMTQATNRIGEGEYDLEFKDNNKMLNNSFKYSISSKGMFYTITIKTGERIIELRDSLKLLPFSVKAIGKAFNTKHQKLTMEYSGFRYAGCEITPEEKQYIANDVLVVKEALEIMFDQGHNKLTIGSCCLSEYKKLLKVNTAYDYKILFPDMYDVPINAKYHKENNAGDWIRHSYKGGWCYLVKGKENQLKRNGTTGDVNSLYPSMMSSESGNRYPVGMPKFWTGNMIPEEALKYDRYFFIRIKTRFYIKKNMLPFIQIKGNLLYKGTEMLETSDIYSKKDNKYHAYYIGFDGKEHDTRVELTLTCTDYKLFLEHYNVTDFEILDGCYFDTEIGIFDDYIEKYKKQKLESTGALRTLAKLFLNNLYGKMASNKDSSFKYAYLKDDDTLGYVIIPEKNKTAGYIPVGSAITSYARNFTIRAAQKNYYGADKPGFIYADTDSIHCDIPASDFKGIKVHDKNFCCWKLESSWDVGIFVRQKTYIEHVVAENLKPIDKPYYNIKCAGMPEKCKNLFELSISGYKPKPDDDYNDEEKEFLLHKRSLKDFKVGLRVPGKLRPKEVSGGVLLVDTPYEIR